MEDSITVLPITIPSSKSSNILPFHSSTRSLVLYVSSIYLITPSQSQTPHIPLNPCMIMVEESKPGKFLLRHPLTAKQVNKIPCTLDMTKFQAIELAKEYNFKNSDDCIRKVVLCSSLTSSSLEVLVLYREGVLGKLSVKMSQNGAQKEKKNDCDDTDEEEEQDDEDDDRFEWKTLKSREKHLCWFLYLDDMIEFQKKYYVVDRKGKLYELDTEAMKLVSVLVSDPICGGTPCPASRRKRLVVDPASGELHLVVREPRTANVSFTVYKLNKHCKKWDVLVQLGNDRLLFVGLDHCFFAEAKDFPGCNGNCIVFAANCFTQCCGRDAPDGSLFGDDDDDVDVGIHQFGKGDNFLLLTSAYPEFSELIWPPPKCFFLKSECKDNETDSDSSSEQDLDGGSSSNIECLPEDHVEGILRDSTSQSSSDKDSDDEVIFIDSSSSDASQASDSNEITSSDEDDEEQQRGSSNEQQGCDVEEHVPLPPYVEYEVHDYNVGTPKTDYQKNGEASCKYAVHDDVGTSKRDNQENVEVSGFSNERVYTAKSTPVTPSANLPAFSTVEFEGVNIKSELLPTLRTIWDKHGSLITEDTVQSNDMRACALESAAKLVTKLQNTTGKNLTDSQAHEIQSTLSDLQRIGLKVDWLVPAVEKVSKLQKHKPVIESIERLNKRKAQVDEEEKQFLARTAKMKQEIEEGIANIPSPEFIDLDDCLGSGLL